VVKSKVTPCQTITPEKKKQEKIQDFTGKRNFILSTMPFSPWAVSSTWLHVRAPQKIQEKITYSDQQNRVFLVIVFILKAITYSSVNKIQIYNMKVVVYNVLNHAKKKN
jgi:hypothetical protein